MGVSCRTASAMVTDTAGPAGERAARAGDGPCVQYQ
jgi:hypothetical protein